MSRNLHELETQREQLQQELDARKTQAERNKCGQFATPFGLAKEIVRIASAYLPNQEIHFLDPAFGTGSFFSAILKTLPKSQILSARGFEIDPHYGTPTASLWQGTDLELHIADFTKITPQKKYNLVVCNPPYVRHHHLSGQQKQHLKETIQRLTGLELNGLSGLYCYFMLLSQSWMKPDGIGAWLVPSEFLEVNYGSQIKQFLLSQVSLLRVHQFDANDDQFEDALVSSSVIFFRNFKPERDHEITFTYGGTLNNPNFSNQVSLDQLQPNAKWTRLNARTVEPSRQTTLADLFTIKRGIATGCNEFFILPFEKCQELQLPEQFLKPILPSPRYLKANEIQADDRGFPKVDKLLFLLDCDLPETEIQERYPTLWAYLQTGQEQGIPKRYLCAHRPLWYSQEKRPPTPFVCTYMGRPSAKSENPFRFILNESQATASNVYLLLYPKGKLVQSLEEDSALVRTVWGALSTIKPEMIQDEGRLYGGGLHKIEPKELTKVSADMILDLLPKLIPVRQARLFE